MHVVLRLIEDVTTISWIFIIFACVITLIEVGRYKLVSEPCRSFPDQNRWISCCMWMVLSYLRYLLCCSCPLGCFPVVCDMYGSTVGTCFGVLFF